MAVFGSLLLGASSVASAREHAAAMLSALTPKHTIAGLVKATAFGFAVACAGCHHGLRSSGTPSASGRAASRAVVLAVLLVGVAETALIFVFKWIRL
jgi:phospholipid/cholesterol/gamma-HCH transport system permease protein